MSVPKVNVCKNLIEKIEKNKGIIRGNLKITDKQWQNKINKIAGISKINLISLKEDYLTFILLCAYAIKGHEGCHLLQNLLCEGTLIYSTEIEYPLCYQYKPYTSGKEKGAGGKSNSRHDLLFGDIKNINETEITYAPPEEGDGWICFVEIKILDDIDTYSTDNLTFNQLIKYIYSSLSFQTYGKGDKQFPKDVHLTLVTPKLFKENKKSRFYGYKFEEYSKDFTQIKKDIPEKINNLYFDNERWIKPDIDQRLPSLKLHWVVIEDIFCNIPDSPLKEDIAILYEKSIKCTL